MITTPDPRVAALDITTAVLEKHQQLDDVLEGSFGEQGSFAALDRRDRAFVRLLATTVLRRLGQLDDAIDTLLDRPLPARLTRVKSALRLGAAQLLFLGTPPHAAVDQTVRLVGRKSPFKGLVNAVLRRLAREATTILARQDAARLNTPDWLWNSWCSAHGEEQARAIVETHLSEPALDISVKSDAQTWAERLGANLLPTGSLRRTGGGLIEDLSGYMEGAWWIQDTAAAMPARLLLSSLDGEIAATRVLDACAAPGGKTAQLAAAGTAVDALDISSGRLSLVAANLQRLRLKADIIEADLRSWQPPQPYPAILVDAPCTSTGTIRRHPDILHLRRVADVERLASLQSQLLDSATLMLAPHGFLIYCTCSLQPEEGIDQIRRILAVNNGLERWPISPASLPGFEEAVRPDGDVQILPHQLADFGGTDGFFISRLRRTA
jgi:16S rRNA (cytosine967-C5)-methyltransferase